MSSRAARPRPLARLVEDACVLEAAARKPGNVHPAAPFEDLTFEDFVRSARAISAPLASARRAGIGRAILEAARAMRRAAGTNAHLGTIILLAPLCAVPRTLLCGLEAPSRREALREALRARLARTTRRDAELLYEAIRLARPAGLGDVAEGSIHDGPSGTLLEMMRLAARRDLVARELARGYPEVVGLGVPALARALRRGEGLEEAVVVTYLRLLARRADTHIARKCGTRRAGEARRRARAALEGVRSGAGILERARTRRLDAWLRSDGHRLNPGATADVITAVLFLSLASGII